MGHIEVIPKALKLFMSSNQMCPIPADTNFPTNRFVFTWLAGVQPNGQQPTQRTCRAFLVGVEKDPLVVLVKFLLQCWTGVDTTMRAFSKGTDKLGEASVLKTFLGRVLHRQSDVTGLLVKCRTIILESLRII